MIGLDWRSAPVRRRKRHFVETIVPESLVQNKVTISLLVWRCSSLEPPASSSRNTAAVAEIQVALFRTIPYSTSVIESSTLARYTATPEPLGRFGMYSTYHTVCISYLGRVSITDPRFPRSSPRFLISTLVLSQVLNQSQTYRPLQLHL